MSILVMSDIHGNQKALEAVLAKAAEHGDIQACILLGDVIDYGMHSNEVIEIIKRLPYPIICSIRGNHEDGVIREDYSRFSSKRGKESAKYTRESLSQASWSYLLEQMSEEGKACFAYKGKKCLAVHGSLRDEYWGRLEPGEAPELYGDYDYVFSGHSHVPCFLEKFAACQDETRRDKKKITFINPGSVGQPRNLNNMAQFAVVDMDSESISFEKAKYDICAEQSAFCGQVDDFYCERLERGV